MRAPQSLALVLIAATWACVPAGETRVVPELVDLAAAALVQLDSAGHPSVTALELTGGRLPSTWASMSTEDGRRFLLTVDVASLSAASHRVDVNRTKEATISSEARASCSAEGDLLDGRLSLALLGRARVFEEVAEGFVERPDTGSEAGWLESFRIHTPGLREVDCKDGLELSLVPVFASDPVFPSDAMIGGMPFFGPRELIDLEILADGRLVAASPVYLTLRSPDAPHRDDLRVVRRIYSATQDEVRQRGAFILASEGEAGTGELWVTSRWPSGEVHLEAIQFDAEGLGAQRSLSRIPVEDEASTQTVRHDVMQLHRLESGALVALTGTGLGLLAPGPEGPWEVQRITLANTRILVPIPTEPAAFLVTDETTAYLWRPTASTGQVTPLGELPLQALYSGVAWDLGGEPELVVAGRGGFTAFKTGLDASSPWKNRNIEAPLETGRTRRCVATESCGRGFIASHIWGLWIQSVGPDAWTMFSVDGCPELVLSRRRDGCPRFVELEPALQADLVESSARRIVERRGRLFRMGNLGDLRELVMR